MSELSIEAELAAGDAKVREITSKAVQPAPVVADPEEAAQDAQAAEVEVAAEDQVATSESEEVVEGDEEANKRFSFFASKEVELRNLEKTVKEQQANLGKSVDQIKAELRAEYKRLVDEDPTAFWEDVGTTYENVSKKMLEKRPDPTALKLKKEVGDLQRKLAAQEAERAEAHKANLEREALLEIDTFVKTSKAHPLTQAAGRADEVLGVIQDHYSENGQVLSYDAAADRVEAGLAELLEKLSAGKAPKAAPVTETRTAAKTSPKTLKNNQAAKAPARSTSGEELLSREASIERASKLIRFLPKE